MSRHTIGNKRGSVRGAPPDVYMAFGSFHENEDSSIEAMKPVIDLAAKCCKATFFFIVLIFSFIIYYAFSEPNS